MLFPRSERASESLQEEVKKKFPKPNCVSFDEVVTVKSIPSYTDYSEEVRNNIWEEVKKNSRNRTVSVSMKWSLSNPSRLTRIIPRKYAIKYGTSRMTYIL